MRNLPEPIAHTIASGRIPSPPEVLVKLLQIVDSDHTSISDLASLVERDPGLSVRLLSVANSSALRRDAELKSVEHCLITLGTRQIRTLATCLSIQNLFERGFGQVAPDLSAFWAHSLLVAELARELSALARYPRPEEAYLAGLLHDAGELVLLSSLGPSYARLLSSSHDGEIRHAREMTELGVHHGEIGTWLADTWKLDSAFSDGILFHHATAQEIVTAGPLPKLVWLAYRMVVEDDFSASVTLLQDSLSLGNGIEPLLEIRKRAEQRTLEIATALNLKLPGRLLNLAVWEGLDATIKTDSPLKSADANAAAVLGGMALLQPLQRDLFDLDNDQEIFLSLRDAARILFDFGKVAFLMNVDDERKLSGNHVADQPAIFRETDIPLESNRSLVASCAKDREVRFSFNESGSAVRVSLIDTQFARALSSEGILCIPMVVRSRAIGVIVCGLSGRLFERLRSQLPLLAQFGKIAASSLDAFHQTEKIRLQAEREANDRFSRQARRAAHEAGNPLGIIKGYLKVLDSKLPEQIDVRQELQVLTEEIDRVANIVSRMSAVPSERAASEGLDLGVLVRELLALYGDTLFKSRGINVETFLPKDPLPVACQKDSLKQILVNLWKNASEALSPGNKVAIAIFDRAMHNGQTYVNLSIKDNGPGLPDSAMQAMNNPSVDANAARRGMGLSIVGELANRQKIVMICQSHAGRGASISLLIPRLASSAAARESTSRSH